MSARVVKAVAASSGDVEAAAAELMRRGNAVDAVVAGVFAACATSPGVLLGPVQLLLGGGGSGLRAVDGRVRQPGLGAPRPRGFRDEDEVPDAARVGVPWLPAALAVAVATAGASTLAQVMAPALALAKGSARHEVLVKIASRGPRAMEERPVATELLAAAGRPSGGLLTADDLSSARPEVHVASRVRPPGAARASSRRAREGEQEAAPDEARVTFELPWANVADGAPAAPARPVSIATVRAVLAVDRHGAFAAACWDEAIDGLTLPELDLRAPFYAEPVRRGQTRARPGDARAAAAPLAMVGGDGGPDAVLAAIGAGDAYDVLGGAVRTLLAEDRFEAHGEARLIGLARAGGAVTALR